MDEHVDYEFMKKCFTKDYISPIKTFELPLQHIEKKINDFREEKILEAVAKIGVYVDKDTLKSAIAGDRQRYQEGYNAGWEAFMKHNRGTWIDLWDRNDPDTSEAGRCSRCGRMSHRPLGIYCKWCGSKNDMEEWIDEKAKGD